MKEFPLLTECCTANVLLNVERLKNIVIGGSLVRSVAVTDVFKVENTRFRNLKKIHNLSVPLQTVRTPRLHQSRLRFDCDKEIIQCRTVGFYAVFFVLFQ